MEDAADPEVHEELSLALSFYFLDVGGWNRGVGRTWDDNPFLVDKTDPANALVLPTLQHMIQPGAELVLKSSRYTNPTSGPCEAIA
ncbi:MAG TPA: hypothetical protein VFB74_36040 [Kribbellaceae bacterium]|nr:hypothetical protein [Kribbellaceae bacterium]